MSEITLGIVLGYYLGGLIIVLLDTKISRWTMRLFAAITWPVGVLVFMVTYANDKFGDKA